MSGLRHVEIAPTDPSIGMVTAIANATRRYTPVVKRDLRRRIMKLPIKAKLRFAGALLRDPDVPRAAKLVLPAVLVYLASPIDVIPDFIPLLGQIDDVLVLAGGLALVMWLTPGEVLEDLVRQAE